MKRYIAVAGNIGAGKTSLVEFLVKRYKLKPFFEPNDTNPYLADFYQDMGRWAFHSQIYFMTHKFRLHRELERFPGTVIQDRTIYEDAEIFARNLFNGRFISRRDYKTYRELYETIQRDLTPPDVMIFLRCSVRSVRQRIRQRGRAMEQSIPVAYLQKLDRLYEDWYKRWDLSPRIEIRSDKLDYITDIVHQLDLLKEIEKYL
ncbi:MAG TPA: deoxynucleoside kinase [Myxococcota bacterium]|nr:deoxynucleoside kinase [Myxococcota bacterium]HRY93914.1 deoxynucleoside kinase [Myxococcota bacterium]